mgnify:FL=1
MFNVSLFKESFKTLNSCQLFLLFLTTFLKFKRLINT